MKQTMSKSKSKQGKKTRKINKQQESKKEDSTQGEYAYLQAGNQRGGGVAPRRNNRITESATKESREAKRKARKKVQKKKREKERKKRQNEKGKGNTENDKRERKKRRKKKKEKKGGKRQGCPGGAILTT